MIAGIVAAFWGWGLGKKTEWAYRAESQADVTNPLSLQPLVISIVSKYAYDADKVLEDNGTYVTRVTVVFHAVFKKAPK